MSYDTPYTPKDNSGSIFKNDRKEKDTHPDGKGSALIDGVEYWISSWTKTDRNGKQYRSLSFQRKEQPQTAPATRETHYSAPRQAAPSRQAPAPRGSQGSGFSDMDDDIPFRDPMAYRGHHLIL
jgi:hypothetical protein